jgi:hypothetical protein
VLKAVWARRDGVSTGWFAGGVVIRMTIVAPRSWVEIVKKASLIQEVAEVVEDWGHAATGQADSPEDGAGSAQMATVGD